VEGLRNVPDVEEVIMDTSSFDEGTLARGYEFLHFRRESEGKDLVDDFREGMYETDRPEVRDRICLLLFWD